MVVVWDLSEFFFFVVFDTNNLFIVFVIYEICVRERDGRVRRRKRAQTTHRYVVWLQVTFFISLFNIYVLLHATFNLQNERWEAATTRKGPRWMLFFPLCPILIISILSYYLPHEYFFILFSQIVGFQLCARVRTWEGSIKYLF